MNSIQPTDVAEICGLYAGWQGRIFELLMGQQMHVGGLASSMELADLAGIEPGSRGVDLCCGSGPSMRLLIRFRNVTAMTGVEATETLVERGRRASEREGLADRVRFVQADARRTGLGDGEADFVWGEDAWCYVAEKRSLVAEAARIARLGGMIAFTDWVVGPAGLAGSDAERLLRLMKFNELQDIGGYRSLLESERCDVLRAEDTGRFAAAFQCYAQMLGTQIAYDALEILGFDRDLLGIVQEQLAFTAELARGRKLTQARFVARKR